MPEGAKELRPHQTKAISLLRESMRLGNKRPILQLATGAGKTVIAANIIRMALEKGNRVAFVVDAVSLIDQTVKAFYDEGLSGIGVIQAKHPLEDWSRPIQVCSVQTLRRRKMPDIGMMIVDECHCLDRWLLQWMQDNPKVPVIGLSATPWTRGLGNHYDDLIQPVLMQELIDLGYLCEFRVFAASKPDLSSVKTVAGEYHEGQLSDVMAEDGLIADVVETWLERSERRPTLVFAVDCAHAQKLQERFSRAGVQMGYVDAFTERLDRQRISEAMKRRDLAGIVSVATMIKGVDLEVGCISDCAPTKSRMRYVQKFGRGLRVNPEAGPDLIYLDHASNTIRLGFPTDIHQDKLCTKKPGEKGETDERKPPEPRECPACKRLRAPKVRKCPSCGFEPVAISNVEEHAGELIEVKRMKQGDMLARDTFYRELVGYCQARGKNPGMAWHMCRERYGAAPREKLGPIPPSPETIRYVQARNIRRAKGQQRRVA